MGHFAKIKNSLVTDVIVAEQDVIDSGLFGTGWIKTSYNTKGNIHYGQDGKPDGGIALRANYAGIGHTYDAVNDVFYAQQPYPSWTLSLQSWLWEAPITMPNDGNFYVWNEEILNWVAI